MPGDKKEKYESKRNVLKANHFKMNRNCTKVSGSDVRRRFKLSCDRKIKGFHGPEHIDLTRRRTAKRFAKVCCC